MGTTDNNIPLGSQVRRLEKAEKTAGESARRCGVSVVVEHVLIRGWCDRMGGRRRQRQCDIRREPGCAFAAAHGHGAQISGYIRERYGRGTANETMGHLQA